MSTMRPRGFVGCVARRAARGTAGNPSSQPKTWAGEDPSWRESKIMRWALSLSAFAALRDPVSRACLDRQIAHGKRHPSPWLA